MDRRWNRCSTGAFVQKLQSNQPTTAEERPVTAPAHKTVQRVYLVAGNSPSLPWRSWAVHREERLHRIGFRHQPKLMQRLVYQRKPASQLLPRDFSSVGPFPFVLLSAHAGRNTEARRPKKRVLQRNKAGLGGEKPVPKCFFRKFPSPRHFGPRTIRSFASSFVPFIASASG